MSLLGTLLRPKSSHPFSTTIAAVCTETPRRQARGRRRAGEDHTRTRLDGDSIGLGRRRGAHRLAALSIADVFVQSLVAASTCRGCSNAPSTTSPRLKGKQLCYSNDRTAARQSPVALHSRAFSTHSRSSEAATAAEAVEEPKDLGASIPREQYEELIDVYEPARPPKKPPSEHYRLAPRLAITPEQEDRPPLQPRKVLDPIDQSHKDQLKRLKRLLHTPAGHMVNETWEQWSDLPTPRFPYMGEGMVRRLFARLAWVKKRNLRSSQRYFSVLEEAIAEGVPLTAEDWNTAVSFAGRWVEKTTPDDVKNAIETWLRMEREGGVSANNVTFNILFDVAVKAGRFALADTIATEMDRRKLELNRYFRTSKIYYAGQRGDSDGVRAAFRELVAAGEIVDTAIMNCVILSLVRCGEAASAEHIMAKMKILHKQKFGQAALTDWREMKAMGRQLDYSARQLRKEREAHLASFFGSPYVDEGKKEEIQRAAPIAPDERTYRILIRWHATASGDLDRIRTYLEEVEAAGYRVHHNIYFTLFNGFRKHGGYAFTAWNRKSLEGYWREYVDTIAEDAAAAPGLSKKARARARARKAKAAAAADAAAGKTQPVEAKADAESPSSEADPDHDLDELADDDDADTLSSDAEPLEFRPGPVMAALAAFYKCAGLRRMLEVWREVQGAWGECMGEGERRRCESVVAEKRRESEVYVG